MPIFTASNSIDVVGSQVVSGGLTIGDVAQGAETTSGLKVTTGGVSIDAGGLTVTTGGATISNGGLTVSAGGLTVSAGAVSIPYLAITGINSDVSAGARFVGGIASGAPLGGTYLVGDVVIDRTGKIWICTTGGSPGSWTQVSGTGGGASSGTTTNALTIGTGLTGGSFDGSQSVTIGLSNSGVTAGSYTNANITVDAKGRLTAASNGTAGSYASDSIFSISSDGLLIGAGSSGSSGSSGPLDNDLTAIAALTGTSGFLKKRCRRFRISFHWPDTSKYRSCSQHIS
ncbi:hypothetical protein EBS67_14570 [bacterium]|nr:hypothetical protein [bacterium]